MWQQADPARVAAGRQTQHVRQQVPQDSLQPHEAHKDCHEGVPAARIMRSAQGSNSRTQVHGRLQRLRHVAPALWMRVAITAGSCAQQQLRPNNTVASLGDL